MLLPLLLLWGAGSAAAADPGSLVKTSESSAVYLFGSDGYRHAFPNERIFFSWFLDFNDVQEVTPAELAAMPLGHNVTYRPGSRLVKITTDPKVYAVLDGGLLRPIASETDASALYGSDWATRVDDLPDVFFVDYEISEEVTADQGWPDDTVVRSAYDEYYVIESGLKRKLSGTARTNLGRFAVQDTGRLAGLSEGQSFVVSTRPYTAEESVDYPETPTFRVADQVNRYVASGREQTLAEFRLMTSRAVELQRVRLKIEALRDDDTDETDEDLGGLVFGNTIRANLTNLRIIDGNGRMVLGPNELVVDIGQDEEQSLFLLGNVSLPADSETVLKVQALVDEHVPNNESYRVTLLHSGTEVLEKGNPVAYLPGGDLVAPTVFVRTSDVVLSTDEGSSTVVRGARDVELARFQLTGGATDTYLERVTLTGYLDSESSGDYWVGGDADGGPEIRLNQVVPEVRVTFNGEQIGQAIGLGWPGQIQLTGLRKLLPAGKTAYLSVHGDIPQTAPLGSKPDRVAFDIVNVDNDIDVVGSDGSEIDVQGESLNYRDGHMRRYVRVLENGSLHFEWEARGGTVLAGGEALMGELKLTAKDDSFKVSALAFWQTGGNFPARTYPDVRLEYTDSAGAERKVLKQTSIRQLSFTDLDIHVAQDTTAIVRLVAPTLPVNAGALYADKFGVAYRSDLLLQFSSETSGTGYSQTDLGGTDLEDFYSDDGNTSVSEIRFASLDVKPIGVNGGDIRRDSDSDTIRFSIKVSGYRAKLKNLTVWLTPQDAGRTGSDNDSLERWAGLNPGADANDVGDLVRVYENDETIIGEDYSAAIEYNLVRGASRLPDPSVDSQYGDRAEIKYSWREGSEYAIAAGETAEFVYRLDTTKFWTSNSFSDNRDFRLDVRLDQSPGFYWTDDPGITGTVRSSLGSGLPVSGTFTVLKP